ncbi:uncharacterized protein LOC100124093 [Nasonia vitripennis]|uniref:Transmembrane protein n=1 Tax=Nasonia vitripennis TaxID=7425 RepID=A0A7M7G8L3_NASVI|nr:uncharacterized protein LOC100124093 [Nasonia vitripennis]
MIRSSIAYFLFFTSIVLTNADNLCQRQPGDELLLSQTLLQIGILEDHTVQQKFEGYQITCVKSNLPLGFLINLSISNGGIGCDSVSLKVKIGKLVTIAVGVDIYGVKVMPGQNGKLTCNQKPNLL